MSARMGQERFRPIHRTVLAVGGEGWIRRHDIPIVHWNSEAIRVDPSRYDTQRVLHSLETAGLDYQTADLWSEAEAED